MHPRFYFAQVAEREGQEEEAVTMKKHSSLGRSSGSR